MQKTRPNSAYEDDEVGVRNEPKVTRFALAPKRFIKKRGAEAPQSEATEAFP